ncbi:MAG: hypothetical protein LBW85_14550 [Deltaproteobacteria bacterium]|jgi:hypothetical protein|nr:hypothetical protein [Deltaproteobacteria bacterium]
MLWLLMALAAGGAFSEGIEKPQPPAPPALVFYAYGDGPPPTREDARDWLRYSEEISESWDRLYEARECVR